MCSIFLLLALLTVNWKSIYSVLQLRCIPSMCPVCKATGKPCDNMRLRRKQYPEVEVGWLLHSTINMQVKEAEGKGRGLFLSKNSGGLVSGDLVYEYLGEVLDYKSFKKRTVEYEREVCARPEYLYCLGKQPLLFHVPWWWPCHWRNQKRWDKSPTKLWLTL